MAAPIDDLCELLSTSMISLGKRKYDEAFTSPSEDEDTLSLMTLMQRLQMLRERRRRLSKRARELVRLGVV